MTGEMTQEIALARSPPPLVVAIAVVVVVVATAMVAAAAVVVGNEVLEETPNGSWVHSPGNHGVFFFFLATVLPMFVVVLPPV